MKHLMLSARLVMRLKSQLQPTKRSTQPTNAGYLTPWQTVRPTGAGYSSATLPTPRKTAHGASTPSASKSPAIQRRPVSNVENGSNPKHRSVTERQHVRSLLSTSSFLEMEMCYRLINIFLRSGRCSVDL